MTWGAVAVVSVLLAVYFLVVMPIEKAHKEAMAKKDSEIARLQAQVELGKKTEEIKDEANKEKAALTGDGGFDESIRMLHDKAQAGAGASSSSPHS